MIKFDDTEYLLGLRQGNLSDMPNGALIGDPYTNLFTKFNIIFIKIKH